ncbi:tRNA (guanosine(46)-N7)-methyltransferase TrmB [Alkaliphilus crotonatoxidans]
MRVRNIPGVEALLGQCPYFFKEGSPSPGKWNKLFRNPHPIHIEIGMGKGRFLTTLAVDHVEINYIGIEKSKELLWKVCKSLEEAQLKNLMLVNLKAENIASYFALGEVERIYLNFSDPWPKARHEKRRLTHLHFLKQYRSILSDKGEIHFKTDGLDLFEFTLDQLDKAGFTPLEVTYDLHRLYPQGVVMTEYEMKFRSQGKTIKRVIAVK